MHNKSGAFLSVIPSIIVIGTVCGPALIQAATITTGVDSANSAMGVAGNGCLQNLLTAVSEGENCMYDGGPNVYEFPPGSGMLPAVPIGESIGPHNSIQYYDYSATPAAFDDPGNFTPTNGDAKIRRVIDGSITIDDQGNGFGTDDEISFTLTITSPDGGDIVRNDISGWVDRYTSMTQVLAPRTADSVTPNAFGGLDYVIGTEGYPLLLTFTDPSADESAPGAGDGPCVGQTFGDMECGAGFDVNFFQDPLRWTFYDDGSGGMPLWRPTDNTTFGVSPTPPGQFDPPHVGPPGSPGLGTMEGNVGARTSGSLAGGVTCNDTSGGTGGCVSSKVSFNPLLNAPVGAQALAEDVDWDQVYLKVSTDARGNVLTAEGFDLQETQIFSAPIACGSDPGAALPACNSWSAGHFTIAGVVAVADTADTPKDTPVNIDVLANDMGFADPVAVMLPGGGTSTNGGTVLINGTNPGPQGDIDIIYTPGVGFSGFDTFDYTVDDGTNSGTATVTVNVVLADQDSDGVPDIGDNCILAPNGPSIPDAGSNVQLDTDGDGHGNACDADLNNDNFVNSLDLGLFKLVFMTADADADLNGDGVVNSLDLGILKNLFFQPPGPSAPTP